MKLTEKKIIQTIREEYTSRLLQFEVAARLAEDAAIDKQGNILLSKDLKVRHKKSGYEYTVDHIDGEGEDIVIYLRKPEVPRIEVPKISKTMNEIEGSAEIDIFNIEMPSGESLASGENQDLEDIFAISAEEFKKEYVVD
jgi:hypothetical protein